MTNLLDTRSTLSDDEVWGAARVNLSSSVLSFNEVRHFGATTWSGGMIVGSPPRASTRLRIADLIEPLLWLEDNWDGHGALAPTAQALDLATRFLRSVPERIPLPRVSASVSGGVLLEWDTSEVELLLEIDGGPGGVTGYVRIADDEHEGSVASIGEAAAEALAQIAVAER